MPLLELSVENLAVIEAVRIRLDPGLNVVTGETGAGKSLVVDALALVLGGRASAELVREGARAARVEAIFDAPAAAGDGSDDALADLIEQGDGLLIVRREVTADGRSLIRVNDRAVTVGSLAALGARLAELHGQHEQQRLLQPGHQLALLDRFGGHRSLVDRLAAAHTAWRSAAGAAEELISDPRELARRVELLEHQVADIDAARPAPGEDAELESQLRAAQHAETIVRSAMAATAALRSGDHAGDAAPGAVDALRSSSSALRSAAALDARFRPLHERAEALAAEAQDLAWDVAALAERIELHGAARAAAEERLALLYDLKRRYGESLEAVVEFGRAAAAELEQLRNQEESRAAAQIRERQARSQLEALAAELARAREAAAAALAERVNAELPALGLRRGAFGAELVQLPDIGPWGSERAEFRFAPNPGEPPRPLARIASGGEASRLSLALKTVLAEADDTSILVFDEIDAGVGGRNAGAIGRRLRSLARFHQVLCVTHLPQLAAHADVHIAVTKRVEGGRTVTDARHLAPDERRAELAAMLGAHELSAEAQAAADALLRTADTSRAP